MSAAPASFRPLAKAGTLVSFVVLMAGFVAFKAGAFESKPAEAPVASLPSSLIKKEMRLDYDTLHEQIPSDNRVEQRIVDEHKRWTMMASSKVLVAADPIMWFPGADQSSHLGKTMISSSKSTMLISPLPWKVFMETRGNVQQAGAAKKAYFRQGTK